MFVWYQNDSQGEKTTEKMGKNSIGLKCTHKKIAINVLSGFCGVNPRVNLLWKYKGKASSSKMGPICPPTRFWHL